MADVLSQIVGDGSDGSGDDSDVAVTTKTPHTEVSGAAGSRQWSQTLSDSDETDEDGAMRDLRSSTEGLQLSGRGGRQLDSSDDSDTGGSDASEDLFCKYWYMYL